MSYFSSARDKEIIGAGGFFCRVCVVAKPASEQSEDPRYCRGCREILQADKTVSVAPDTWLKDDMIFVHYGKSYVLTPGLSTVCLDDVSDGDSEVLQGVYGMDSARQTNKNGDIHGSEVTQKSVMGRKPLDLPVKRVLELSAAGRSIRDIADETFINRETVRRIVNGQRVMGGVI